MRDDATLHWRLDAFAAREQTDEQEVEALLTEGYAHALAGEGQSRQLERQLARLLPEMDKPEVAMEVRRLALQRRTVDQAVAELRRKLAGLRGEMTGAHGRPSPSA